MHARPTRMVLSIAALALMLFVPASASAAPSIVTVAPGIEPLTVAKSVGATVTFRYDTAMNGFAADLSSKQVSALSRDKRVVDVAADEVLMSFAMSTKGKGKPGPTPPPVVQPAQITTYGQDRMGLLDSPTAKVDGIDERVDADVAVVDTGVAPHPDLNLAGGVDCAHSGNYGDTNGHGTLVAGFVGAIDNAFGVVGVAPGARIWSVKVMKGSGVITQSSAICGMEWVRDNASMIDVANLSFGGGGTDVGTCASPRLRGRNTAFHAAVCNVIASGVTVVAAAGNEATDVSTSAPAAFDEVIAVSAFTETDGLPGGLGPAAGCTSGEFDDHIASFSNFGAGIDFAAPGVCVTSTHLNDGYWRDMGTSFAAPHVAGAAALVKARMPGASPAQVEGTLAAVAEHAPLFGDPDGIAEPLLHVGEL